MIQVPCPGFPGYAGPGKVLYILMEDQDLMLNVYLLEHDFTEEFLSRDISEIPGYRLLEFYYVL